MGEEPGGGGGGGLDRNVMHVDALDFRLILSPPAVIQDTSLSA